MKEINFRAINAEGGMIYGLPYTDGVNDTLYYKEFNNRLCWRNENGAHCNQPYKNGTLMQYIGLKDKNQVEIFEGDIVAYDGDVECSDSYYVIEWVDELCGFQLGDDIPISDVEHLVILGNIYENPDLLES